MVVGTADRNLVVFNLQNPQTEFKRINSPLKYQTRCVAAFPDQQGFWVGSIEGRVGVLHLDDSQQSKNFTFKCHRDGSETCSVISLTSILAGDAPKYSSFYKVKRLHLFVKSHVIVLFVQIHHTFATAGSDGAFNFWDKDSKQRLKAMSRCGQPIPCSTFNNDGSIFAYLVCYDWSNGAENHNPATAKTYIYLHLPQLSSMERYVVITVVNLVMASFVALILTFAARPSVIVLMLLTATACGMIPLGLIIICYVKRNPESKGEDLMRFDLGMNRQAINIELTEANKHGNGGKKQIELPFFSFSSVCAATNNFSATNKLGEGGFGPVYKGVLAKGDEIAVKRLSGRSGQGLREMKNEASVIAKVQHKNLVRLLGCCIDKDEKILIYEYMPNKSLDFFLFDPTKRMLLDWVTRLRIIEGIAQGLLYLYQYSRMRIIHRDLKASNILLNKDMNPKISDFGMARIFGENELQANTSRIVGTYGYMSPEYAFEGIFSIKSDVFSFGVLLLEIAWDLWTSNRTLELIDPILEDEYSSKHMLLRYVNTALLCVQESADDRPTMNDVVSMLTNEAAALLPPKQPAFSYVRNTGTSTLSTSKVEDCSVNQVTISILEAR
ncbi:Receptor-like serine/threonine-protein kinase [Citrus sinensis]|nr:Receptor-like serine/threonine-protein kinase [Citrus sinensis]